MRIIPNKDYEDKSVVGGLYKMVDDKHIGDLRAAYMKQVHTLTEWLLNLIKTEYEDDIAIVVHENNLIAPGYEESPFPHWFIPVTERGKKLAMSFIIAGKKHDLFYRTWDDMPRFESVEEYDTMIVAEATVWYACSEEVRKRFEDIQHKLSDNLRNDEHMRKVAIKDFNWAVDVFKECVLAVNLWEVMMNGCYVCDLLVHSIASLNNRYILKSFTDQYEFLQSCSIKPEGFEELYMKINASKNASEIKDLCAKIVSLMRMYLGLEEKHERQIDAAGLATWYEEMIDDWNRIRGYAQRGQIRNVRGWANKLQYSLQIASRNYGTIAYPLLEKFDNNNITEFFEYADWVECDIRRIIKENNAHFNEFQTVDEFILAYECGEVRV